MWGRPRAARIRRVYFYVTVVVGMHMSVSQRQLQRAAAAVGARVPSLQAGRAAGWRGQQTLLFKAWWGSWGGGWA
jgi:hypothetical protein